ncbi:MAG: hypothetical protein BGO55_14950 [Sphingobacteriales bacterium 50-39]|nr:hypothetical protein [Sphingobacteriales bacterium]OJW54674.1 MAG: hypothetical protein BGO55_14950 [Sphingobacteriales bacterium 50-39]
MAINRRLWYVAFPIFLGCHSHVKYGLPIPPNVIPWSADSIVHWRDFQGRPPFITDKIATTATLINYKPIFLGNVIKVEVIAYFLKDSSWKVRRPLNSYLLNHERRHFDISEITARQIRKYLQDWRGGSLYDYDFYVHIGEKTVFIDSLNARYDLETDHAKDTIMQGMWNRKIDSLLEAYKRYETNTFKVKIGKR